MKLPLKISKVTQLKTKITKKWRDERWIEMMRGN